MPEGGHLGKASWGQWKGQVGAGEGAQGAGNTPLCSADCSSPKRQETPGSCRLPGCQLPSISNPAGATKSSDVAGS